MTDEVPDLYRCPESIDQSLRLVDHGLQRSDSFIYPFIKNTRIPVFDNSNDPYSEYSAENAAELHDNALSWLFRTFATSESDFRTSLIGRLAPQAGETILITGVGAGNDLPYVAEAMSWSGTIYAQDISPDMILAAADRYEEDFAHKGLRIFFSVGDAERLPFGNAPFDRVYHCGGINLFSDIGKGVREMDRVTKPGGKVLIADEGVSPWLQDTELGKQIITNNALYGSKLPLAHLPSTARDVRLSWELFGCFYVIEYEKSDQALPISIDVPHVGRRGGSIRTRHEGRLEGVDPDLKAAVYEAAEQAGVSRVDFLERALRAALRS